MTEDGNTPDMNLVNRSTKVEGHKKKGKRIKKGAVKLFHT